MFSCTAFPASSLRKQSVIILLICGAWLTAENAAATESEVSALPLRAMYNELGSRLLNNQFRRALYLNSVESSTNLKGEIYAVVDYPFATVDGALNNPARWCDVLILHLNIKYCNAAQLKTGTVLNVYLGQKNYQALSDAYLLAFNYRSVITTPTYFALELNAADGPLSTQDYRIWIEATSLNDGRSFLHITYAYTFGFTGRLAMQSYLATLGRGKLGFTIIGKQANAQPRYIHGVRAVVERNTMRYYLAINAYLAALDTPPKNQLEKRLQQWYSDTEPYARQLHEIEREEYLVMKRREYQRQQVTQ